MSGRPLAQMQSPRASSTVRSIVRRQDLSLRGLCALESSPIGEHATFPGSQRRDARSAQLHLPTPRRSYLTRRRDVNKLPEVKVDNTVVAVLQVRVSQVGTDRACPAVAGRRRQASRAGVPP